MDKAERARRYAINWEAESAKKALEIVRLRDAMERAIANLDDNHARRVLTRALSRTR